MNTTYYPFALRLVFFCAIYIASPMRPIYAQNCPGLGSLALNVAAAPAPFINGPAKICPNSNATLAVAQQFNSYEWSTGSVNQSISITNPGNYGVTVTNDNGCKGTATIQVLTLTAPSPVITAISDTCLGKVVMQVDTGYLAHLWSTGSTSNAITVNTSNVYSVTVTNAAGCTATNTYTVSVLPFAAISIAGNTSLCQGDSLSLTALPASAHSFQWSNGQTGASITVVAGGTYTVSAINQYGCMGTDSIKVIESSLIQALVVGPSIICDTSNTLLSVLDSFSVYSWSSGALTDSITVNLPGTYTVTVTNALGCTAVGTHILSGSVAPSPDIHPAPYACNGQLLLETDTGFANYLWSNQESGSSITIDTSGTYSVTITNAQGCSGTNSFTAIIPALPVVAISGLDSICPGLSTLLDATPGFAQYAWSNGASNASIPVNAAGTFTVTITDANGCTSSNAFNLNNYPFSAPQILGVEQICTSGNAGFSVSGNYTAYLWSTGESSPAISTNINGTYTVTVTSADGCTGTDTHTLVVGANLQPVIQELPYVCNGQISLDAGNNFALFEWNDGQSTQSISVVNAGTYTVTVGDGNGCTGTAVAVVSIPAPPMVDIAGNAMFCSGNSSSLSLNQVYSQYAWSTGATTANITITTGNTYTVTVTDNLGCTATDAISVQELLAPSPGINLQPYLCDGQLVLQADQGFTLYSWTGPNGFLASGPQAIATTNGNYALLVTDTNGCTGTSSIQATIPVPQNVALSGPGLFCVGTMVDLNASGGFVGYLWNNGATQPVLNATAAGTYTVTATDALGCTTSATHTLENFPQTTPSITGPATVCLGDVASLSVGTTFQSILWSNGSTANAITETAPFTASVTITDGNGCTGTATSSVGTLNLPTTTILELPYQCDNQITLDAGPGFQYDWSGPNSYSSNLQQAAVGISGVYTLTITDANGCTNTGSIPVAVPTLDNLSVTGQSYICPGQSAALTASGNFVSYQWSTGQNNSSISVNQANTYSVTATDGFGCTVSGSFEVELSNIPAPGIIQQPYQCNQTLQLDAEIGFSAYQWSNGQTAQTLEITQSGTYTVMVTNAAGCTGSASIQALIPAVPSAQISGALSLCTGSSTTLTATGNALQFSWSNGSNSPLLDISAAGTYTVTATDAYGCTTTALYTVSPLFPVSETISQTTCRPDQVGTQNLVFTAANGCDSLLIIETSFVPNKPGMSLELAPLIEANIGQEIQINVGANFPIDSVSFQSPFSLSCSNCIDPVLIALAPGFVQVEAFDPDGCLAIGEIQISINSKIRVFVPNIFQPGSGENGFFSVFSGPEIKEVQNFQVFDRWGNALFQRDQMPTNTPGAGWDGSFRNQLMLPGVYVYYFELLLSDGSIEPFSGDITLVR